jgi:hypothetical protein
MHSVINHVLLLKTHRRSTIGTFEATRLVQNGALQFEHVYKPYCPFGQIFLAERPTCQTPPSGQFDSRPQVGCRQPAVLLGCQHVYRRSYCTQVQETLASRCASGKTPTCYLP